MFLLSLDLLRKGFLLFQEEIPQLTFTCSKSTIEALAKGVKYVQSSSS